MQKKKPKIQTTPQCFKSKFLLTGFFFPFYAEEGEVNQYSGIEWNFANIGIAFSSKTRYSSKF